MKLRVLCLASSVVLAALIYRGVLACDFDDADILALEISGALTVPDDTASQIRADLVAIRADYPFLEQVHALLDWDPCQILVDMTQESWIALREDMFYDCDQLNTQYGCTDMIAFSSCCLARFMFAFPHNAVLLSAEYSAGCAVENAFPELLSSDGDDIELTRVGEYVFWSRWGDCLSGCIYGHYWRFQVENGNVSLIDEGGDPLAVREQTWSRVKRVYRE